MGFLGEGNTLTWEEVEKIVPYIKEHGVLQFIEIWKKMQEDPTRPHLWGDEVEFTVVHLNHEEKTVHLNLKTVEILHQLEKEAAETPDSEVGWRPEYGCFMIEAVPGSPYDADSLDSLLKVEANMVLRRKTIEEKFHNSDNLVLSVSHFPLLGCPNMVYPQNTELTHDACNSKFTCDEVINPHHRFGTLTKNIRVRKGSNVAINIPVFKDVNTPKLTYQHLFPDLEASKVPGKEDHVYCDSMAFGMGQSCLQVTFQAEDLQDSLNIYDGFLPLTPIMLALSASTPTLRGYLTDYDGRWEVISQAVDDRTDEERGFIPLKNNQHVISKSRYASVSSYLGSSRGFKKEYNDIPLPLDQSSYDALLAAGIPVELSRHLAHLFIRDPLVIYNDHIELDDATSSDHFENIQSTNWQSLRFKPPPAPAGKNIGWRVEFRTMDLQFTDFENAAFSVFICLLTHAIRNQRPNFYLPISKVDENMLRAHARDAVLEQKFWFRKDISSNSENDEVVELSIGEIMNGSSDFGGVIPLVKEFLDSKKDTMQENTWNKLQNYLNFISARASGKLSTNAHWIRKFITSHPDYKKDSLVTHGITYDLLQKISLIQKGQEKSSELYGEFL
eukprot:TRINITY_DN10581_c0_g1_i1.p1 TRINITY_DN10581_c0_g1~~TRINITY_DN10581_c0_g1_i1.p1  ORF type:complete len:614 (-),score=139.19 TRINITY_DN10581_c0_g1_i1:23-1864(-)